MFTAQMSGQNNKYTMNTLESTKIIFNETVEGTIYDTLSYICQIIDSCKDGNLKKYIEENDIRPIDTNCLRGSCVDIGQYLIAELEGQLKLKANLTLMEEYEKTGELAFNSWKTSHMAVPLNFGNERFILLDERSGIFMFRQNEDSNVIEYRDAKSQVQAWISKYPYTLETIVGDNKLVRKQGFDPILNLSNAHNLVMKRVITQTACYVLRRRDKQGGNASWIVADVLKKQIKLSHKDERYDISFEDFSYKCHLNNVKKIISRIGIATHTPSRTITRKINTIIEAREQLIKMYQFEDVAPIYES